MRLLKLLIILSSLFIFGCRYGMSENPTLVEDNPKLFGQRGKLQEAIGIDVGKDRFVAVIPTGAKGSIAEAINITRAAEATGSLEGIEFSLHRGNSEKVSENTTLGNYEILISEESKNIRNVRLLIGIHEKKIVMEATHPSSGLTIPIRTIDENRSK